MADDRKPITVLQVDDDDLIAQIVKITLKHAEGFEWLGQLRSTDTLIEVAQRLKPDVVLLDLCLPGESPFNAVHQLSRAVPHAKVIIFSGRYGYSLVDRAVEAGAWGYVSKDGDSDSLLSAIKRVAAGKFAISEAQCSCPI